jgi:hypothetical protein
MVCEACSSITVARQRKDTLTARTFTHHLSFQRLLASAEEGCELCKAIIEEVALANALPPKSKSQEAAGSSRGEQTEYYIDYNGEGEILFQDRELPPSWEVKFGIFTKDGTFGILFSSYF